VGWPRWQLNSHTAANSLSCLSGTGDGAGRIGMRKIMGQGKHKEIA